MTRKVIIILCLFCMQYVHADNSKVEEYIEAADVCYWIGLQENGNLDDFDSGINYLEKAEMLLNTLELQSKYQPIIDNMRSDLEQQWDMAHDTISGVFPLARYFKGTLFYDPSILNTYEIVDDADIVAVCNSIENLKNRVEAYWLPTVQIDVLFVSNPVKREYENEALYIFNGASRFYVHNAKELAQILTPVEIQDLYKSNINTSLRNKLYKILKCDRFILVNIPELKTAGKRIMCISEGTIFSGNEPEMTIYSMGFSRILEGKMTQIVCINALCLAAGIVVYVLFRTKNNKFNIQLVLSASLLWFIGRITPYFIISFISFARPSPETLAILAFWWPCLLGLLFFVIPVLICRIIASKFPFFGISQRFFSNPLIYVVISLGVLSYLATPILAYCTEGIFSFVLVACGIIMLSLFSGRVLNPFDPLPVSWSGIMVIMICILSFGITSLQLNYVIFCTIASLLLFFYAKSNKKEKSISNDQPEQAHHSQPATVEHLAHAAIEPAYFETANYHKLYDAAKPFINKKESAIICINGKPGLGKSSAVKHLCETITDKFTDDVEILKGHCSQDTEGANPYSPFQSALANFFEVDIFAPMEGQANNVNELFDGVLSSLIPFSDILFASEGSGDLSSTSSKEELFVSISKVLNKIRQKKSIVFFIDNVDFISSVSIELTQYLIDKLSTNGQNPVLWVLAGRNIQSKDGIGKLISNSIEFQTNDFEEQCNILTSSLGFDYSTAELLLNKLQDSNGNLFWTLTAITFLAKEGCFSVSNEQFVLSEEYQGNEPLPVPDELQSVVLDAVDENSDNRIILELACCLGVKFRADVIAQALRKDYLSVLSILRQIQEDSGLIIDIPDKDGLFAFRSSIVFELLRSRLGITSNREYLSEMLKEYYSRIASSLEDHFGRPGVTKKDIALFYFLGGNFKKAVIYSLEAAMIAISEFDKYTAKKFLERAKMSADICNLNSEYEFDILKIEFNIAHIFRDECISAGESALNYYANNQGISPDKSILIARTIYDAAGINGDQNLFAKVVEIGNAVFNNPESSLLEKAEGIHFAGLAMPLNNPDGRKEALTKAYDLLKEDTDNLSEIARISNSLAEQLSYGNENDKIFAEKLFNESISIKLMPDHRDIPGLARSYGGLGRLNLFANQPDIAKAKDCFNKDLQYSIDIGDIAGQSQMYSLLAFCDRKEKLFQKAIEHYSMSIELSVGTTDLTFAKIGMLECYIALDDKANLKKIGQELLEIINTGIPNKCITQLKQAVSNIKDNAQWVSDLTKAASKL